MRTLLAAIVVAFVVVGIALPTALAKDRPEKERPEPAGGADEDAAATGRARGPAEDDAPAAQAHEGERGYAHAFGTLEDDEARAEARAEWQESEKGRPSWLASIVAKVRGGDADASADDAAASDSDEKRHHGFAKAMTHVPAKVAEKMRLILDGLWGNDKAEA